MLDDTLELLDRQHAYIQRRQGQRLLISLRRYVDVLLGDPNIRRMLDDLEEEAFAGLAVFAAAERPLAGRMLELADELVRLEPTADDSGLAVSAGDYADSLANLRAHAAAAEDAPQPPDLAEPPLGDRSRVDTMLGILRRKIEALRTLTGRPPIQHVSQTDLRPDLAGVEAARAEVAAAYHVALRQLQDAAAGDAGFALLRLRYFARAAGGDWAALDDQSTMNLVRSVVGQHFPTSLLVSVDPVLTTRFSSEIVGDVSAKVEELAAKLREEEDLLHDELHRRIGSTRSRAAVVVRFRQRCEWYDHTELRALAVGNTRRAEALLTNALTRYLFDAGLNPIAKPLTGRLEPDILDPSLIGGFYVEVKQYTQSAPQKIKRGAWQAHDTLATLRQTRYDVREGFYIVFRRGGPRYAFPFSVPGEGWMLYPMLIDLAPEVGSLTTTQAETFSVEDFAPRPAR